MRIRAKKHKKNYKPSLLEKWGVRYLEHLGNKFGTTKLDNVSIDQLPADCVLESLSSNITEFAAIVALGIGGLTTFVTIWIEWTYKGILSNIEYYYLYIPVLLIMLVIEFFVLFWLGLRTVYSLSCLTGNHQPTIDCLLPIEHSTSNILARAALELPDPIVQYLEIDPFKHLSKYKLFMVAVLYKLKVVLSSMMFRVLLTDTFGKGGTRTTFSWVAIPITGLWDAYTLYKVAKEARLRLFGQKLAEYISMSILTDDFVEKLSSKTHEGAIRAVATMMVLTQNYHPNMLILLTRMSTTFEINTDCRYDDWDDFLKLLSEVEEFERFFLLDILCVASAFDGKLSKLEKIHLPQAYQEFTETYMLRSKSLMDLLVTGKLHAAKDLCLLDFNPG